MRDVTTLPDFKLSYTSLRDDKENYFEELLKNKDIVKLNGGDSLYNIAAEETKKAYFKKELWIILSEFFTPVFHYSDQDVLDVTNGLLKMGEYSRIANMWKPYINERLSMFWDHAINKEMYALQHDRDFAGEDYYSNPDYLTETWPKIRDEAIGALTTYSKILKKIGDINGIAHNDIMLKCVRKEELPDPKNMKPTSTKIDIIEFWKIIENANKDTDENTDLALSNLSNILEDYKSTEIKKFQQHFNKFIDDLNTWDLWALIYLAQDGCSDQGFLDFRKWIVMKGEKFFNLAVTNINKIKTHIPIDGSASCGSFNDAVEYAYMIRSGGKILKLRKGKYKPPKGKEWEEASVDELYPKISAHFTRKKGINKL